MDDEEVTTLEDVYGGEIDKKVILTPEDVRRLGEVSNPPVIEKPNERIAVELEMVEPDDFLRLAEAFAERAKEFREEYNDLADGPKNGPSTR